MYADTGLAIALFVAATLAAYLSIGVFNRLMRIPDEGQSAGAQADSLALWRSIRLHPIFHFVPFVIASAAYCVLAGVDAYTFRETLTLAVSWTVWILAFDLTAWVVVPHPLRVPSRIFYLEFQPWISLKYLAVLAAPFAVYAVRLVV